MSSENSTNSERLKNMGHVQMSESILVGLVLALSGGFMDAYSYLFRGGVFANAQTGNFLLIGINIFHNNWEAAFRYIMPVSAFTIGIIIADMSRHYISHKLKDQMNWLHWRQGVLVVEMLCLSAVAFLPQELNSLANGLISLACGIQMTAFKKVRGHAIATTMCIGNLRAGTEYMCRFIREKSRHELYMMFLYYGAIFFFIIGAVIGSIFIKLFAVYSILFCVALLFLALLLMFRLHII